MASSDKQDGGRRIVTGIVVAVLRIGMTRSGNPRHLVVLDGDRAFKTRADSQLDYGINNSPAHGGIPRGPLVNLMLDGRNTVTGWELADGEVW